MFKKICQLFKKIWHWLFGHKASDASGLPQLSQPISPPAQLPMAKILELMSSAPPQYQLRKSLCTYSERIFYEALQETVGSEYLILIKVRMGDIIWLEPEKNTDREKIFRTQIWGKHVDFLLCNKWTLEPLLAIELDDKSHGQYDRREADEFKNKAFALAKLPLLRVNVQKSYLRHELRTKALGEIDTRTEK